MKINLSNLYRQHLIEQDDSELGIAFAELKANCLDNLIDAAQGETRDALQANKYLLEFSYRDKKKKEELKPILDNRILEDADALLKSWKEQV